MSGNFWKSVMVIRGLVFHHQYHCLCAFASRQWRFKKLAALNFFHINALKKSNIMFHTHMHGWTIVMLAYKNCYCFRCKYYRKGDQFMFLPRRVCYLQVHMILGALVEAGATCLCRLFSRILGDLEPKFSNYIDAFFGTSLVVAG